MPKATSKTTFSINLELTEEEARWLLNAIQNPIGGLEPHLEPKEEKEMRASFWQTLSDHLDS